MSEKKKDEIEVVNPGEMTDTMLSQINSNMHGYYQEEMALMKKCRPSAEAFTKEFAKRPMEYFKAVRIIGEMEQKERHAGFGNVSNEESMHDINKLGLMDKLKIMKEMEGQVKEMAEQLGYKAPVEAEVVIPSDSGKNRLDG